MVSASVDAFDAGVNTSEHTSEWVMPLHVAEYLRGHSPQEYRDGVRKCGDRWNITLDATRQYGAVRTPGGLTGGMFFTSCITNFASVYNVSNHSVEIGFNWGGDFERKDKWPCLAMSAPRQLAPSTLVSEKANQHRVVVFVC
jgi:hypothetical protein